MNFQKKYILIFICSLLCGAYIGYSSNVQDIGMYYTSMGIEIPYEEKMKDQEIEIRVCNNSGKNISEIQIQQSLYFENIDSESCSDFKITKNIYKSVAMSIYTKSEKFLYELYYNTPHDLMGVEYIKKGKYSININSLDSKRPPIIQRDNAIEYEIIKTIQ